MSATATPSRTVVLSVGSNYYDAAAVTREADFGRFLLSVGEDFTFSGATRSVVIGRLRREIRNNPYLAGLVNKYPEAIGTSTLRSRTSSRAFNDLKDKRWFRYAKRMTNAGDSLRTMEDIIKREDLIAGESFFIKLVNGRLQPIPSEYCGSGYASDGATPADVPAGGREVNGIVRNAADEITHYRFGKMGVGGAVTFSSSTLVEARHVIHVFEKDRVYMGRGIPRLVPSLRPAHDLYEITRAKTKQIKDVTSIFGTLEKQGAAEYLRGLGAIQDDLAGETTAEASTDAADPVTKGPVRIKLEPGTFIALEPGEKLNKLTNDYQASDYKELIMILLHTISTPVGLPVELWFSGLGDVSYSGFKGLGTQWNARRRYLIGYYEEKFLDPLYQWWTTRETALGDLPANPDSDDDLIDWRWRATAVLDEEKARKANPVGLASGEISLADVWEANGLYAEEVLGGRRQLWIKLQVAAGLLTEGDDHSGVIVPLEFLLTGEIGEAPVSKQAGTKPGSADPSDPADPTKPAPAKGKAAAEAGNLQSAALNGAQVTSLADLVTKAANGEMPIATAKAVANAAFPLMTEDELKAIFDPLDGFTPKAPDPAA